MSTKNGIPMRVVTAPTGMVTPHTLMISLMSRSAAASSRPPMIIDAGNSSLWSPPSIILARCGTMSPTNPMIPTNATHIAVRNEARSMARTLNLS